MTENSEAHRVALLITNMNFKDLNTRREAGIDEQAMLELLTNLGYEVVKYRDLSGKVVFKDIKHLRGFSGYWTDRRLTPDSFCSYRRLTML